jgi:simple sugar transport system permease protein
MNNRIKFYKDKLFYSDKRRKSTKNLLVSALAIICSLIVALIIAMIIYKKGSLFFKIIGEIFTIPFTSINYSKTISNITIFAVGGLGFIFAFRAGLFNIGLSGQMLFGGIVAILIGQHMVNVPNGLGQILILVISIVAAATIAGVIGALKAFFNMSEVVSSILFN